MPAQEDNRTGHREEECFRHVEKTPVGYRKRAQRSDEEEQILPHNLAGRQQLLVFHEVSIEDRSSEGRKGAADNLNANVFNTERLLVDRFVQFVI
jgi:hypothetical protein